jgi:hypothetical protein
VWGPPLSAQDFYNGQQLLEVTNVTEETRQAIKTGIQSEALHRGEYFYSGLHPRISSCSSPLPYRQDLNMEEFWRKSA